MLLMSPAMLCFVPRFPRFGTFGVVPVPHRHRHARRVAGLVRRTSSLLLVTTRAMRRHSLPCSSGRLSNCAPPTLPLLPTSLSFCARVHVSRGLRACIWVFRRVYGCGCGCERVRASMLHACVRVRDRLKETSGLQLHSRDHHRVGWDPSMRGPVALCGRCRECPGTHTPALPKYPIHCATHAHVC